MEKIQERKLRITKKSKQLKKMSGITLIALVLTIIVLLILVGITISLVFSENGIIVKAREAAEKTNQATTNEQADLKELENKLDGFGENNSEDKNTLLYAVKTGIIKPGDYVNYHPSEVKTINLDKNKTGYDVEQSFTTDMNVNWRVLGLNEDGNKVLLISGSPIKKDGENPYLRLQGPEGYVNGVNTLNEICSIYENEELASEVRSITIDDINHAIGGITVDYEKGKVYSKVIDDFAQESGIEESVNIGETTTNQEYIYKENEYSPESVLKGKQEIVGKKIRNDAYMYELNEGYSDYGYNAKILEILFKDTHTRFRRRKVI